MSAIDTKAMQDIHEPLFQAIRCIHLLHLALAGFPHSDVGDEDAGSALRYIADEIEAHVGLVMATWKQADDARAAA